MRPRGVRGVLAKIFSVDEQVVSHRVEITNPGDHFEVTLTVPGVYDYYCMPHEAAGMVGRIVVGKPVGPGGPGAQRFDYWEGKPGTDGWRHVPEAARQTFPSVARILADGRVHPAEPRR